MSRKETTANSRKRKQEKGSARNRDTQLAVGGELHQIAGGEHPALTTNQGTALSDSQNSLRANPRGPTLLEDFILREKITHFDHERIPERIVHARATGAHGPSACICRSAASPRPGGRFPASCLPSARSSTGSRGS